MSVIAAATLALVMGGIAFAAGHHAKPTTTPQTATFSIAASKVKTKSCTGTDGKYMATRGTYRGTMSGASDSRLNGKVSMKLKSLVNQDTGDGTTTGKIRWLGKHSVNARGHLWAVDTATGTPAVQTATLHGFIRANANAIRSGKGKKGTTVPVGHLFANFKAMPGSSPNSYDGQLGGSSTDTRTPAVLQSGHC